MATAQKSLTYVDPNLIKKNPENPRMIFREEEMDALMRSIDQVGIQVPLSVYEKSKKFILIDGERRWRCSLKLGLSKVPIIVEPQPGPLNNLLMMFNIHNVRVSWDLIAIAYKIDKLRNLVRSERKITLSKKDLADLTGVSKVTIERCDELLALPQKYQDLIWKELEKPKGEQKFTEDLFLEIRKGVKAIESHLPEIIREFKPEKILTAFFEKYKAGIETNRVKFRDVSKIARGALVGIPKTQINSVMRRLIVEPSYTIQEAFDDSVASAYSEVSNEKKITAMISLVKGISSGKIEKDVKKLLLELRDILDDLLSK